MGQGSQTTGFSRGGHGKATKPPAPGPLRVLFHLADCLLSASCLLAEPPSAFSTQISPPLLHSLLCVLEAFYKTPSGPTTSLICSSPLPPHRLCLLCVSVPSGCWAEGRCSINANLKPRALYNGSQHTVGHICGFCRASVGVWGSFPCPEWSQTCLQSSCREP